MKGNTNKTIWIALAAGLACASGCGVDDNDTNDPATGDETQPLTIPAQFNCQIEHPLHWVVAGFPCAESPLLHNPTFLAPGQQATFRTPLNAPNGGTITLLCDANGDGQYVVLGSQCLVRGSE